MGDFFDIVNFMMISDAREAGKFSERLGDLKDRAQYLAQKSGTPPITWYEFKRENPAEPPNTLLNAGIGSGVGAAIGLGVAATLGAVAAPALLAAGAAGLVFGGAIGSFHQTENTQRADLVKEYEKYLDHFEHMANAGVIKPGPSYNINYRNDHGEKERARAALPKVPSPSV